MSVWSRIIALAAKAFEEPGDAKPTAASVPAKPREAGCDADSDDVGFTAAVIGLAAKMARADGKVTQDEVAAAAAVFRPPPGEEANFRRVFALAQQSVHGFDSYARQIGRRYRDRPCLLEDVLDGLFHIARADGALGAAEDAYLATVAEAFGLSEGEYRRIRAANMGDVSNDPYAVLGLTPDASLDEAQRAWRRLVQENHPDRLIGRGAPQAFIDIARDKTAAINAAFSAIRARAAPSEAASAG
jgi:DnaJ like chaperone protein